MKNLKDKIDDAARASKNAAGKAGKAVRKTSGKLADKMKRLGHKAGRKMGA